LITVNNTTFDCQGRINADSLQVSIDGYRSQATISHQQNQISLFTQNGAFSFTHILPDCGDNDAQDNHGGLTAPMNGTMISVLVNAGDCVEQDQPLVIMEAMKMEHTIRAPSAGTVDEVFFNEGDMVDGGAELLSFTAQTQAKSEEA